MKTKNKVGNRFVKYSLSVLLIAILFFSCSEKKKLQSPLFATLDSSHTHLNFINQVKPTPQFNLFSYMYYYNGAGVGSGDFNNDGFKDLGEYIFL